jgi:hypothetical protein
MTVNEWEEYGKKISWSNLKYYEMPLGQDNWHLRRKLILSFSECKTGVLTIQLQVLCDEFIWPSLLYISKGYISAVATWRTMGYNSSRLLIGPVLLYWGCSWLNVWLSISLRLWRMTCSVLRLGWSASAMLPSVLSDASLTDASCKTNKIMHHHHHNPKLMWRLLTTI